MGPECRTTLGIAHRPYTIRHAVRLHVLKESRVVEVGPHAELLLKPDGRRRRKLVEMQNEINQLTIQAVGG